MYRWGGGGGGGWGIVLPVYEAVFSPKRGKGDLFTQHKRV